MDPLQLNIESEWPYKLRFVRESGTMLVYDGLTRFSEALTEVYQRLAGPTDDTYARGVTGTFGLWLAYAEKADSNFRADADQCRKIFETLVTERYGALISHSGRDGATVHCRDGHSAHSINSSIVRTQIAFEQLKECGLRKGPNPFLKTKPARVNKAEHRRRRLQNPLGYKRTPFAFYKTIAKVKVPIYVTDEKDTIVRLMRRGGKRVKWSQRDTAVFELLVSGGCRVSEEVEPTLEGWSQCQFGTEIKVHDKNQGPEPRKTIKLTPTAFAAINAYFIGDRRNHDKRFKAFSKWAEGRGATYTIGWYVKFLQAHGIALSREALFLTDEGDPYTKETYTKTAWDNARKKLKITPTPHHLRHWYINKQLRLLEEKYGKDINVYYERTMDFLDSMGWVDPFSVLYYDHEGRFLKMLRRYKLQPKLLELPKTETAKELLEMLGVVAG